MRHQASLIIVTLLAIATMFTGCKTAEVAVAHPMAGIYVTAKFVSHDVEAPVHPEFITSDPAYGNDLISSAASIHVAHRLPADPSGSTSTLDASSGR